MTVALATCPSVVPQPDEFGVIEEATSIPAVACFETTTRPMSKEFTTKGEAEEFIKRGRAKYKNTGFSGMVESHAIDWVLKEKGEQ